VPRVFDNLTEATKLFSALQANLEDAFRGDFCIGYFNLRGWGQVDSLIEPWAGGDKACARVLIGMQELPDDELRRAFRTMRDGQEVDNATALRLKGRMAKELRNQLTLGTPNANDEAALRRLSAQLKAKKVTIKLHLRHLLHAKLYLCYRKDSVTPLVGYLGSSNLTFAGLRSQGELNIDVTDQDAATKLAKWFNDRWSDDLSVDISDELAEIIDESWAREKLIPPYHIYLKMAYHLSQEARAGLDEFKIPKDFGNQLFEYQTAAVKIAAHHLNKRGGVLIGDVVGLGKTLMATALARVLQDDFSMKTLIICPKNLEKMWKNYKARYNLNAEVLSLSKVQRVLPTLPRYRLIIIDESHNLRNREGKRYKAIQEYIKENDSKCILLTATPYNKAYLDLSAQLRLFVSPEEALGIRPERMLATKGETWFSSNSTYPINSLGAFEKSEEVDDWRELMRLYLVRRTRSFIQQNYATLDESNGRRYLTLADNTRSYFPVRQPKTVKFKVDDHDQRDQYACLYHEDVVDVIDNLNLPRYGLGSYVNQAALKKVSKEEARLLEGLSRAKERLKGFCRTNLFKRLESSGSAFIQSVERHILRNYVYLYALEKGFDLPIGTQSAALLDPDSDSDLDPDLFMTDAEGDIQADDEVEASLTKPLLAAADYHLQAEIIYRSYATKHKKDFNWLKASYFVDYLKDELANDCSELLGVLNRVGAWEPGRDRKLGELVDLLTKSHPDKKVLLFTQFADTAIYLGKQLKARGLSDMAVVTGQTEDPTAVAWRFSPRSNNVYIRGKDPKPDPNADYKPPEIDPDEELRVLIATDVLSEGQNLQDCAIAINYDLPWAIIRLIQRAGRVDRIGQTAERILCYSFLPAEGVERIIRLRQKVSKRLRQNAEVVGTDEQFFEGEDSHEVRDLYNEKAGILDGDVDEEVDLASYAYQIWKNASPEDQRAVTRLPDVVYATRQQGETSLEPNGVLVYTRTADGNDALVWVKRDGKVFTQSQLAILQAARCEPRKPLDSGIVRAENHHELVAAGVEVIESESHSTGGQLGRPTGARFRVYERLKAHAIRVKKTPLWDRPELPKAIGQLYEYKLRQSATDTLNRELSAGIDDYDLADLVIGLYNEDSLCRVDKQDEAGEPQIVCSLGLYDPNK